MNRTFWIAVGAVGGIAAYRRGVRVTNRARELGPLGSAQAIAAGTGRVANRTANGLGRIIQARERRAGRLITGSAEQPVLPTAELDPDLRAEGPNDSRGTHPGAHTLSPDSHSSKDGHQ